MADQEGMPILHTLPPEKHSLRSKNIRIFHLTGIRLPRAALFLRAEARCLKASYVRSTVQNSISSSPVTFEPFVDAERAASFLDMPRKTLLGLARSGQIPAHGIPGKGQKRIWKFRISELDRWMQTEVTWGSDQGRIHERKRFL